MEPGDQFGVSLFELIPGPEAQPVFHPNPHPIVGLSKGGLPIGSLNNTIRWELHYTNDALTTDYTPSLIDHIHLYRRARYPSEPPGCTLQNASLTKLSTRSFNPWNPSSELEPADDYFLEMKYRILTNCPGLDLKTYACLHTPSRKSLHNVTRYIRTQMFRMDSLQNLQDPEFAGLYSQNELTAASVAGGGVARQRDTTVVIGVTLGVVGGLVVAGVALGFVFWRRRRRKRRGRREREKRVCVELPEKGEVEFEADGREIVEMDAREVWELEGSPRSETFVVGDGIDIAVCGVVDSKDDSKMV